MANSYIEYTANGSTTSFAIPFTYTVASEVAAFVNGVSTSFTFTSPSTASISPAPANGLVVRFSRTTNLTTRAVDFSNGAILTETDLDNSNIQVFQASQEAIDTAQASIFKDADGKFNAQTRVIKNLADPVSAQDAVTKSWAETGASSQLALTVAAKTAAATSETNAASSATASANSATASASSATGAASSATAATNNGAAQVTLATAQVALATTQAGLATTQAGLATTNGATQVALATTQAGLATTNGAAQVTLATAQKAIAVTKASEASASASTASTQATAASSSATAAASSATGAASSATSAAASLDSFTDQYLGAKSSDPAVDNDNNALVAGALYFSTASDQMKVWTGSLWEIISPSNANQTNIDIVAGNIVHTEDLGSITAAITTGSGNSIDTVGGAIANVNTVAGAIANVNTVGAGIANVNTVGSGIANVNTVAGSIADVNRYANEYKISSSAPAGPSQGDLWLDTAASVLKYYTGSAWSGIISGITSVAADSSPQLGGALDGQNNNMTNIGTISGANLQLDFGGLS